MADDWRDNIKGVPDVSSGFGSSRFFSACTGLQDLCSSAPSFVILPLHILYADLHYIELYFLLPPIY